jgi:hypothetical protein
MSRIVHQKKCSEYIQRACTNATTAHQKDSSRSTLDESQDHTVYNDRKYCMFPSKFSRLHPFVSWFCRVLVRPGDRNDPLRYMKLVPTLVAIKMSRTCGSLIAKRKYFMEICKSNHIRCNIPNLHLGLPVQPIIHRIRPLGLVVKRITSILCYDKIASSILAEGIGISHLSITLCVLD